MSELYKNFLPDSPEEVKVTYDPKLGLIAEEVWNRINAEEQIVPYRFNQGKPWRSHFGEISIKDLPNKLSEETHRYIVENLFSYLGFEPKGFPPYFLNADIMEDAGPASKARFTVSRIPTILSKDPANQLPPDCDGWVSATWHMDFGHDLDTYKFIIYVNDVEPDSGGILFTDPLITPHLPDGRFTWEYEGGLPVLENGYATNLIFNTDTVDIDEVNITEVTGKKGTVVCFNSHIAHTANPPETGYRKALHLVVKGPPAKPYIYGHMNQLRTLDEG